MIFMPFLSSAESGKPFLKVGAELAELPNSSGPLLSPPQDLHVHSRLKFAPQLVSNAIDVQVRDARPPVSPRS